MRTLGIDFGIKRVGLAVAESQTGMAFPLGSITRGTRAAFFEELLEIIAREAIECVVVGLPLALDGSDTLSTRQARNFAASLARRVQCPVDMVDERCSSCAAHDDLLQAGVRNPDKYKAARDQQAAVHILAGWLAQEKYPA